MHKTIDFAMELDPDYATFSITIPYAGTEMYEEALASGLISEDYWKDYALSPVPNFSPPKLIENHVQKSSIFMAWDHKPGRGVLGTQ